MRETIETTTVLLVAGKGGVGKSTLSASLGVAAASLGRKTIVVALSPSPILDNLTLSISEHDPCLGSAADCISTVVLKPEEVLTRYLEEHGMAALGRRLIATGVVSVVATAIPGIRELLVLAKIKQIERSGEFDTVILDSPASGHLVTFLSSPKGLADIANVGLLRTQADDVIGLLSDPARCKVIMVTLPEETPVSETLETIQKIEELKSVTLGPVIVNGLIHPPDVSPDALKLMDPLSVHDGIVGAYKYVASRSLMQTKNVDLLRHRLGPLALATTSFQFNTSLTSIDAKNLGDELLRANISTEEQTDVS